MKRSASIAHRLIFLQSLFLFSCQMGSLKSILNLGGALILGVLIIASGFFITGLISLLRDVLDIIIDWFKYGKLDLTQNDLIYFKKKVQVIFLCLLVSFILFGFLFFYSANLMPFILE